MSKPSNCISVTKARELQKHWLETRGEYIKKEMGTPDAFEFLFSIDELQQFIDYVKAGTTGHTPGVRIYLGAYNAATNDKATVFLVPTLGITADSENNYDLEVLNNGLQGIPPRIY